MSSKVELLLAFPQLRLPSPCPPPYHGSSTYRSSPRRALGFLLEAKERDSSSSQPLHPLHSGATREEICELSPLPSFLSSSWPLEQLGLIRRLLLLDRYLQHHLQKTLVAGAKKAQTFETQRLIKKIAQLKFVHPPPPFSSSIISQA